MFEFAQLSVCFGCPGGKKMQRDDGGSLVQVLVHDLCKTFAGDSRDALNTLFKSSLVTLSSNISPLLANNEVELVEKIKRKLAQSKSDKEAADFSELCRKLQSYQSLRDRWPILYLLYQLSQFDKSKTSKRVYEFVSSTPLYHNGTIPSSIALKNAHIGGGFMLDNVSSIYNSSSVLSCIKASRFPDFGASGDKKSPNLNSLQSISSIKVDPSTRSSANSSKVPSKFVQDYPESIVRDVVFVLQGIDGKCIFYDKDRESYKIISEARISTSASKMVSRLCECGFLHNKIRHYLEAKADEHTQGLIRQSFCSALHQELIEYYRLIANMEAHIQQEEDLGISEHSSQSLTLRRMLVWLNEPSCRLRVMASLVDVCQGKKGGELASVVHSFMKHGDPNLQSLTNKILAQVAYPIFNFVWRWIYDGELEDPFHEFFVASDPSVKDDKLWREKYSLRENMIPSFVTPDQARKILLTGKTISFLRRVCSDRTLIKDREVVRAADTSKVETMLSQGRDGSFNKTIDVVYKETSSYLLRVLYERYKFMEHLKAMRKYLLLGQGDFIRHLMDLLEEDLAKPAQTVFLHNLSGILESAIRATNVQYDDPDIVKRLDVQRLEVSPGDTGWMVFSLEYHISGHIRTVFTPESMSTYLKVSNFLWRAKRMEYILSVIWREQMAHARILRNYSEFAPILHISHLIASEMLHFVQQIQYYINFEVLECSWVELMSKVEEADDLDQVIFAHHEFLNAITSRSLLDPKLKEIVTKLKEIFDLVIKFQETQEVVHSKLMHEVEARNYFKDVKESRTARGEWATDDKLEEREQKRKGEFIQNLVGVTLPDLKFLGQNYKKKVEEFLSLVSKLSDISLRCLIFRLNFNEHYRHLQPQSNRTSIVVPPSVAQPKRKVK